MKVLWSNDALKDRSSIFAFLAERQPAAAKRIDDPFDALVGRLAAHPLLGKAGIVPNTREAIPHERYRLVYRVDDDHVLILALVHTARLWPPIES